MILPIASSKSDKIQNRNQWRETKTWEKTCMNTYNLNQTLQLHSSVSGISLVKKTHIEISTGQIIDNNMMSLQGRVSTDLKD